MRSADPVPGVLTVRVGRYEILETIGQGAFGRVVRAHDPLIGRIVAVKLFPPELARADARQHFLKEARVVGQLSHPSIIALHDMGFEEPTSTPYLVMELVDGQPLDKLLTKGSIAFPRACAWAGDVASALAAAHRRGVIHGDVKPANILINEYDSVKLTDFGMARLASLDSAGSPLLGTPAYWCPEQLIGKPQDARSDVFSLGVVLYEMVTGQKAFQGETLQAIGGKILSATPLASHVNPALPRTLNDLIERCMAKDPAARYQGADVLAAELYPLARRTPLALPRSGSEPASPRRAKVP